MFISKSKVDVLMDAIEIAKEAGDWSPEDEEILNQVHDRASLCQHGDANFLEVEVCYATKPPC